MDIKNKLLKWLGEGILILISVLLAFVIEEQRQKNNERNELITLLTDLESSFRKDSLVLKVRIFYLNKMDSANKTVLTAIEKKQVPDNLGDLDVFNPLNNYSLKRVLNSDNLGLLSTFYRDEVYFYNSWLDYVAENYEKKYDQNCSRLMDMMYEDGEQVAFTPRFKGLIQKNRDLIKELIYNDSSTCANASELVKLTQTEIKNLREN